MNWVRGDLLGSGSFATVNNIATHRAEQNIMTRPEPEKPGGEKQRAGGLNWFTGWQIESFSLTRVLLGGYGFEKLEPPGPKTDRTV
jgi:hypothetical protein